MAPVHHLLIVNGKTMSLVAKGCKAENAAGSTVQLAPPWCQVHVMKGCKPKQTGSKFEGSIQKVVISCKSQKKIVC